MHRKAYLKLLYHKSAVCDCCFEQIRGEWFRCVYCTRDLCRDCLQIDTHDDTHLFIVFKSKVRKFRQTLAHGNLTFVKITGQHADLPVSEKKAVKVGECH